VSGARPSALVVRAYALRGARLWLAVRAATSAVFLLGGANPLRLAPSPTLVLLGLTVAVAFVDLRRHGEAVFLGNLGLHPATFALLLGAPAVGGEILIRVVASLLP
jgi:hypothetical protein